MRITLGGYQIPESVHSRAAAILRAEVEARLGDSVDFEIDGNIVERGRKAADLLSMTEGGELTLCYFSSSYLADRVPEMDLLDLPFLVRDRTRAYAALDGPLGELLAEKTRAATGFRILGFWDNGFRQFSNRVRPIRRPADCRGLRIRNLFSRMHTRTFEMLGFETVKLDVRDLPPAVRAGDVDAQDNPLTNIRNFGFLEHHRYITMSGHFLGCATLLCHAPSYESWPAEVQRAVDEAAAVATAAQRGFASAADAEVLAAIDPAQNEIHHLSDDERAAFVAAVAPLVDEQRERFGPELIGHLEPADAGVA
ncbi:MAG: TRAP transporter substrate-binding protein [Alphaproteobacteria bacterium]